MKEVLSLGFENKAVIIGVHAHDWQDDSTPKHFVAKIVLIDQSNDALKPLLYRFKEEKLVDELVDHPSLKTQIFPLHNHDAFTMMGEVMAIDRQKKLITLERNITVSYQHLVVAVGLSQTSTHSPHDEEMETGLINLVDALKIQKRLITRMQQKDPTSSKKHSRIAPLETYDSKTLLKLLAERLKEKHEKDVLEAFFQPGKKLYEVQL